MKTLDADITAHNTAYVDRVLERDKVYFDNILKQIDPNIQLDEEQRRAVITDDDYCLWWLAPVRERLRRWLQK